MPNDSYPVIAGYFFEDNDLYREALKESNGVRYVKTRTDMNNPMQVLRIYSKMIEQSMFQTQIGYNYLRELQVYLHEHPAIPNESIPSIPVTAQVVRQTVPEKKQDEAKAHMHTRLWFSVILNIGLTVAIIIMFAIAASSSNPTILNYENQIIDKYSDWEKELDERERELDRKAQTSSDITTVIVPKFD